MSDIHIRKQGVAGRITLTRPQALNAMTYEMCMAIDAAFDAWRDDPSVQLVILDAKGERAFCSGGDIAELYATGMKGDYAYGRKFWSDEYRLNYKIFSFPKPVVSFLQGFTMGGGVGIGCHGTHRIVGESSQIAMPECGIGLVPDVGGSLMLALAPGRLGEYLGTTAARMNAADAIYAGFADTYVPEEMWTGLIHSLLTNGDLGRIESVAQSPNVGPVQTAQAQIDRHFAGQTFGDILRSLKVEDDDFTQDTLKRLSRNAPLSMATAIETVHRLRGEALTMARALDLEYRFTFRAMEHGDFLEGIRAAIIDKDRNPQWQYADMDVPNAAVSRILMPLGDNALNLKDLT